jgi:endoglycosylceramidase
VGRLTRTAAPVVLGLAALCLVVGAASAGASSPTSPPVTALGPLHRAGGQLVDQDGRVVLLHGVNVVWKAAPFYPPDVPGGLTDLDLQRIADHGWNAIRLGVSFAGLMPQKGLVDHAYLDHVASVIQRIAARGMYTLLDVHQDAMGAPWGGNGFPGWAIHETPALEAIEPPLPFPLNSAAPSHTLAWDAFWSDQKLDPGDPEGVQGYLTDALGALADRVAGAPGMAGIEIVNEVWGGSPVLTCLATIPIGCPLVDQQVQRVWQRITDRIRQASADLVVWWEPASTFNLTVPTMLAEPPVTPAVADPQVAFAFHDYCAFGELSTYFDLPPALQVTCDVYHDRTWANAAAMRARSGMPQLVTEFGNIDDAAELDRALSRADTAFTGWQYWHYGDGFHVRPASTEPFSPTQLARLSRTYPTATAGTPGPLTFDPSTGVMTYSYAPRAGGGAPTEIAVSDVHDAHGYTVRVDGGRVVSAPGAPCLLIAADAGASRVDVTVRPAAPGPAASVATTSTGPAPPSPTPPAGAHLPATGRGGPVLAGLALAAAALVLLRVRGPGALP